MDDFLNILKAVGIMSLILAAAFVVACCKVSGDKSRDEELNQNKKEGE